MTGDDGFASPLDFELRGRRIRWMGDDSEVPPPVLNIPRMFASDRQALAELYLLVINRLSPSERQRIDDHNLIHAVGRYLGVPDASPLDFEDVFGPHEPMGCTGAADCDASYHVHGCFADNDVARCSSPRAHLA